MKITEIKNPEFIFGEIPIKDDSWNDNRIFITSVKYLSIIECFRLDEIDVSFPPNQIQKTFVHKNSDGINEDWLLVFTQNNISIVDEFITHEDVLQSAWEYLELYLIWEDINIDFPEN